MGLGIGAGRDSARCRSAVDQRSHPTPVPRAKALDGPIEAALAASDDVTLRLVPAAWRSWAAPVVEPTEGLFLAVDA